MNTNRSFRVLSFRALSFRQAHLTVAVLFAIVCLTLAATTFSSVATVKQGGGGNGQMMRVAEGGKPGYGG